MAAKVSRIKRVQEHLKPDGVDAFLFTDLANIFYLSGFRGSDGALLVLASEVVLLVDGRYGAQAREQAPECTISIYAGKTDGIGKFIKDADIRELGFEARSTSVAFLEGLQKNLKGIRCKPFGEWILSLRAVKEVSELNTMRQANKIADDAFSRVLSLIKPGISERDISLELEYQMKKAGAEKASFPILVASGERTALPHASPTNRKLRSGEFVFIDFGCIR